MRKLSSILSGLMLATMSWHAQANGQSSLCETQVRQYVTTELGQTIEHVDLHWTYNTGDQGANEFESQALVYTKECTGYHWFNLLGNFDTCELQVYYGSPPNLVFYRGGYKGC
ncbi:MAG: hypothetical protein GKR94_30670 [Gammaproteobacteria bacterium]|nr:hypothetical protein [Gammaproteobacteria bacterium]